MGVPSDFKVNSKKIGKKLDFPPLQYENESHLRTKSKSLSESPFHIKKIATTFSFFEQTPKHPLLQSEHGWGF